MRIQIPLVVEMTDDQVEAYVNDTGLPRAANGKIMARDIVDDIRSYVLSTIQESAPFGRGGADVSIKR